MSACQGGLEKEKLYQLLDKVSRTQFSSGFHSARYVAVPRVFVEEKKFSFSGVRLVKIFTFQP